MAVLLISESNTIEGMDKRMICEEEAQRMLLAGELVRVRDAAVLRGISAASVYHWVAAGRVRAFGSAPMLVALPDLLEPVSASRPAGRPPKPRRRGGPKTKAKRLWAARRGSDLAWLAEYREMIAARRGGGDS